MRETRECDVELFAFIGRAELCEEFSRDSCLEVFSKIEKSVISVVETNGVGAEVRRGREQWRVRSFYLRM